MTDTPAPAGEGADHQPASREEDRTADHANGQPATSVDGRAEDRAGDEGDARQRDGGPAAEGHVGKAVPDLVSVEDVFTRCRTAEGFASRPVSDDVLRSLYDLLKMGPTSGNCSPARFAFLRTEESRQGLRPALSLGNVEPAMGAPVLVVVGYDPLFFEKFSTLNPTLGLRDWFAADVGLSDETAFRNGTLQGAYLIMAARALGLAVRPMSGFDAVMVEEQYFRKQGWRANFLVALGYPQEEESLSPRAPRLPCEEACLWL